MIRDGKLSKCLESLTVTIMLCQVWGVHSFVAADTILLRCGAEEIVCCRHLQHNQAKHDEASWTTMRMEKSRSFETSLKINVSKIWGEKIQLGRRMQRLEGNVKMGVKDTPYILESNPHPFYSFRGLKNQMRIRIACGLDSRPWTGFWKNDRAAVRAVRTIQYNDLFFIYYL